MYILYMYRQLVAKYFVNSELKSVLEIMGIVIPTYLLKFKPISNYIRIPPQKFRNNFVFFFPYFRMPNFVQEQHHSFYFVGLSTQIYGTFDTSSNTTNS